MKFKVFWDVAPCSLTFMDLMMKAVHTSETSVHFNVTSRRYNTEDAKTGSNIITEIQQNSHSVIEILWYLIFVDNDNVNFAF
jgi:hypothetical protein